MDNLKVIIKEGKYGKGLFAKEDIGGEIIADWTVEKYTKLNLLVNYLINV